MPDLPTDPLGRVEALLRARQVSCRGNLADLAHALVQTAGVAQLQRDLADASFRVQEQIAHAAGIRDECDQLQERVWQLDARADRLTAELAAAEAIAVREHDLAAAAHRRLDAVLADRDTLTVQLELVCDAIEAFSAQPTQPAADAVEDAVDDARTLLADDGLPADLDDAPGSLQPPAVLRAAA